MSIFISRKKIKKESILHRCITCDIRPNIITRMSDRENRKIKAIPVGRFVEQRLSISLKRWIIILVPLSRPFSLMIMCFHLRSALAYTGGMKV